MEIILKRLAEPSTWAGFAAAAAAVGIDPDTAAQWVLAVTGVAGGILAIVFGEKGEKGD